jgi:hypothetical protein
MPVEIMTKADFIQFKVEIIAILQESKKEYKFPKALNPGRGNGNAKMLGR